MIIRPAAAADNEALCRMELLAPQGTALRLTEQRRDFFARARQFPGSILMVAADDTNGKLAGVLGGAPVDLRVAGRERRGGFLFDFRSNPEFKRGISRIIYQLWEAVERHLLEDGVEFIYGLVKEDNPAASIYQRMETRTRGIRTFWTLPVYRRRQVPAGVRIRSSIDAGADYQEAARWYRDYDLWPVLADPSVLQPTVDRYLRAEITHADSSLKIWDSTVDYERIVSAAPFIYDLARPVADAVRTIFPVPRIPRVGQPLRTWYLYDCRLPGGSRQLRPLLDAANNLALENGVDFLILSASEGEADLAAGGRGSLATLHYMLSVKEYRPVPEISHKTFLDIRMV